MKKRLFVLGIALLFAVGITGCGDKIDEDEQREAENLVQGIGMMAMMTNVDAYSGLSASGPGINAPPFWEGPMEYSVPEEWESQTYYRWLLWRIPLDSMGTKIDTTSFYLMFHPDVWDTLYADSIPTRMEVGIDSDIRDIWFYTIVTIPDSTHVTGSLTWNWDETWYDYDFDVSQIDESATIDITTSSDIGLAAHFMFNEEGYGSQENNYAEWHNTVFVRFEFFSEPDSNGYDGFYTLLSEAWKVEHYFTLNDPPTL